MKKILALTILFISVILVTIKCTEKIKISNENGRKIIYQSQQNCTLENPNIQSDSAGIYTRMAMLECNELNPSCETYNEYTDTFSYYYDLYNYNYELSDNLMDSLEETYFNQIVDIVYDSASICDTIDEIILIEDEINTNQNLENYQKTRLLTLVNVLKYGMYTLNNEGAVINDITYQVNGSSPETNSFDQCFNLCISSKMRNMNNVEKVAFYLGMPESWIILAAACFENCSKYIFN